MILHEEAHAPNPTHGNGDLWRAAARATQGGATPFPPAMQQQNQELYRPSPPILSLITIPAALTEPFARPQEQGAESPYRETVGLL